MDDEVIMAYREICRLDFNPKRFGQLPRRRSAFRCVLDSPHTLISEVAEKHVRRHGTHPLSRPHEDYATIGSIGGKMLMSLFSGPHEPSSQDQKENSPWR